MEIRAFNLINVVFFFVLLSALIVLAILHYHTGTNFTLFLKFAVVIISTYSLMAAKARLKWFHSFVLFIGTFILFNFSRVFFDLFNLYDLSMSDKYVWYKIPDSTLTRSLLLLLLGLVSANLGFYIYNYLNEGRFRTLSLNPSNREIPEKSFRIFLALLIIVTPGTLLKLIFDLYYIKQNGFLALYTDMAQAPAPFRLSWFLFSLLFPIILVFRNKKKVVFFAIILFCIVSALDAFKGTRNALLRPLLILGWYYYSFYSKKDINLKKILGAGILILYFAFYAVVLRDGGAMLEGVKFGDVLTSFLTSQGVTFLVMVNYLDFQNQLINPSHFYIFYPIQVYLTRFISDVDDGHNHTYMYNSLSLDHKLTYIINPDLYLSGVGSGSSFIVELYALGGVIAIIAGSFIVGYLINKFECDFRQKPVLLIFGYYWISHIIWMSRSGYLPNLVMILLSYAIFYFISGLLTSKHINPIEK